MKPRFIFVLFIMFLCVWLHAEKLSTEAQASRKPIESKPSGTLAAMECCRLNAKLRTESATSEYLWYEAENMRGLTETARHEPLLSPSFLELPAARAPGWCISGPGVSAEWSQGGESEWNSVGASADETHGTIWQELEVPRSGDYKIWIRYADFGNKNETFVVRIAQN